MIQIPSMFTISLTWQTWYQKWSKASYIVQQAKMLSLSFHRDRG